MRKQSMLRGEIFTRVWAAAVAVKKMCCRLMKAW